MKIIKYKREHEKEVQNLVQTILFEIFGAHKITPFEDFDEYAKCYVALDKNKIVASIALRKDKDLGTIKRLYVNKDYRKQGLAQKMYNKLEVFAKKSKIHVLELSTTPQMIEAIRFYKKNGFKKTGQDIKANKIFFRKKLI